MTFSILSYLELSPMRTINYDPILQHLESDLSFGELRIIKARERGKIESNLLIANKEMTRSNLLASQTHPR